MTFIRHDAKISVGPRNIDVVLELTFHEYPSLAERRRMDRNHDEAITEAELKTYLDGLTGSLRDALTLHVDDRPLEVIPLYDPQIDLLDTVSVAPAHHVLRLSWFARTPEWLHIGSRMRMQYRLWSEAPRIDVLSVAGRDGVRLVADDVSRLSLSSEVAAGPREISLSCHAVPDVTSESSPAATGAGQPGMSHEDKLTAGVGAVLLLVIAAATIGGVRRCVFQGVRAGGQT